MIIDEENIRVQYESTKESPILRDDVLPYPYRYTEKDQIYVLEGVTELTRNEDFSVSYDGSVTILKDIPIGTVLTIYRSTPLDQGSEFPQEAPFSSKKIEDALDKLTMQNQEQREALSRALKLPMTASTDLTDLEMPTPEPNRSVKWNAEGTALVNTNFDPDTALEQTEKFKKEAEQAAKDAVAAKESITTTEDILVNTAKQATDEINVLAEETQEAIANASKHKLNSKEIASLLVSSAPQEDSDLALADGRFITSEDECHGEFHNNYMVTQRQLTDKSTKYFRYDSYNMSRRWYCTVESTPDKFYGLTDIINAPAGTWYLMDRAGEMHLKSSVEVKSYYKYELINAVGHDAPQYLLWQVFAGDAQIAEPDTTHNQQFYAFSDDERIGAKLENITNIVVLPPDVTSEFRRIQFTQVDGENTYYYYYKATPIEIHAYANGAIADIALGGIAGGQTDATVVKPYLRTSYSEVFEKTHNDVFLSTNEYDELREANSDYSKFYTATNLDTTYETNKLHDDVVIVGYPHNRGGVFSGFTAKGDYLKITKALPQTTSFEGVTSRSPITSAEIVVPFVYRVPETGSVTSTFLAREGNTVSGWFIGVTGTGTTATEQKGKLNVLIYSAGTTAVIPGGSLMSLEAIEPNIPHVMKLVYNGAESKLTLWLSKNEEDFVEQSSYTISVDQLTQYWSEPLCIGSNSLDRVFNGEIDLKGMYIAINNQLWWGGQENFSVPYAFDEQGTLIEPYSGYKTEDYHKQLAANVYETNPTGFTPIAGLAMSEDGWMIQSAANQWMSLTNGSTNRDFKLTGEYNEIHIKGSMRTSHTFIDTRHFGLLRSGTTSCPLLMGIQADKKITLHMGRTTSTGWSIGDLKTTIAVKANTEYEITLDADFNIKYVADSTAESGYKEDSAGTLYKYVLKLKEWSLLEEGLVQTFEFYNSYRFGAAALDYYSIQGLGFWTTWSATTAIYLNFYDWSVNGLPLFAPNIHVVDRQANSTALPKISKTEEGNNTYVVVANGVEEEVILADPKTSVDNYVATTVNPSLSTLGADLQKTLQNSYNQYNKTLTSTYNQGVKALQNASDAVRKSDLQEVYCVVETYRNGTSWYRIWSDGWIEQGGYLAAGGTIQLLQEFKYPTYNVSLAPIAAADPYVSNRTTTTLTIAGGGCLWIARGY